MNKRIFLYSALGFLCFTGTAFADSFWYTNATYTTVQSGQPSYSLAVETLWNQVPYGTLPNVKYIECINGSCTTSQYSYTDPHYPYSTCDAAAAHAGIANTTYTCSQNYNEYGWSAAAGGGGGDGGLGVGTPTTGWYRQLTRIELYTGSVAASAPCKAEPSDWAAITQNGAGPAYHYNECTTSVHMGTVAPTATLTAAPSSITAGNSTALTYSCSDASTSAVIDNGVGAVSPAAAGTKSVTPGATTTYKVTCTNANGTGTASATVTVTPLQPDLTPIALTPHTVIAGQASTFTATLLNGGTAATPNFSSTIFVCAQGDAACQSSILGQNSSSVWTKVLAFISKVAHAAASINITLTGAPIPANTSGTQSGTYTFASPGTYQARLCADLPANQVTESNENNNCGNWEILSVCPSGNTIDGSGNCVPPVATAPTCSLTANPTNSAPSTLTWSSTNATTCTGGGFSTGNATNGSVSVPSTGPYTVSCTGAGGSCSTSATIGGGACVSPTGTISATPTRIQAGQSSTVSYSATGITTSCTVSGPGVNQTISAASCTVPSGSAPTGALTTQAVYKLTCDGVVRATTIVNVTPQFKNF